MSSDGNPGRLIAAIREWIDKTYDVTELESIISSAIPNLEAKFPGADNIDDLRARAEAKLAKVKRL